MRDIKVVAYGAVSEDDERLIENYLTEKMNIVRILSVDTAVKGLRAENDDLKETVRALEEIITDLTPEPDPDG